MEWIDISTSTELHRYSTDDIVYIIADGNYSNVFLVDEPNEKPHLEQAQLHVFEEKMQKLKDNHFARVSRGIIVNKNFVTYISLLAEPNIQLPEKLMKLKKKYKYNPNVILSDKRLKFVVYLDIPRRDLLKELKKSLEQEANDEIQSK